PDLVRVTRTRQPSYLGRLVDSILSWLHVLLVANILPPKWDVLLRGLQMVEPQQKAGIDFLLYSSGEQPRRGLDQADQAYRDAMVALATSTSLPRTQQERFIDTVAAGLGNGWSRNRDFYAILDTLWLLSHPEGGPPMRPQLIIKIADELCNWNEAL